MRIVLCLSVILMSAGTLFAGVKGEEIEYSAEGVTLKGYLAYDDALSSRRPGVLVVHEWWGHNEYARKRANMLAELGYTALAVDMYGDGKTAGHPQDAGRFASEVRENIPVARGRFEAALAILKAHPTVDPVMLGAIGYCFGGSVVLQMAREGVDLRGVVSFHGSLGTEHPAAAGAVKARILVCHGAADSFIPESQVAAFKGEMDAAGAIYKFNAYEGAKHSFTNPDADKLAEQFGMDIAYHADADAQSWEDMQGFFRRCFAN